jgi:putative transposase
MPGRSTRPSPQMFSHLPKPPGSQPQPDEPLDGNRLLSSLFAHGSPRCPWYTRLAVPGFQPLRLLLTAVAGWVHREQARTIEYLIEENRVLKEQLGGRRLRLTDDQRRRLAAKGVVLGRRLLARVATIVTPDTILRWHHRLIAAKWTYPTRRVGRPGIMKEIRALIVRMADDNSSWGYCRIQGELKKLGHRVARSTIAKTLKEHGIKPSPDRPTTWRTFLRSHADAIAAADFFTAEVWTARGLVTHYVLFVIDHATRAVEIPAGITTNPDSAFMAQVARNLTDHVDGFLRDKRYLILDAIRSSPTSSSAS